MPYRTHDRYLETEVLNADPLQLVNMLYRGALEAVVAARFHLAAGSIMERSRRIMKAWNILHELSRSIDPVQAPELSARLMELYVHMQQRLLDANIQQADGPLAEVQALLATLSEAWQAVQTQASVPPREPNYEPVSRAL
jgi:flagellar protein FliS